MYPLVSINIQILVLYVYTLLYKGGGYAPLCIYKYLDVGFVCVYPAVYGRRGGMHPLVSINIQILVLYVYTLLYTGGYAPPCIYTYLDVTVVCVPCCIRGGGMHPLVTINIQMFLLYVYTLLYGFLPGCGAHLPKLSLSYWNKESILEKIL